MKSTIYSAAVVFAAACTAQAGTPLNWANPVDGN